MKKIGILLGTLLLTMITSCTSEDSSSKQEAKKNGLDLTSRLDGPGQFGYFMGERATWTDNSGNLHIAEYCDGTHPAFCDIRPIINPDPKKSKFIFKLMDNSKLLVSCVEKAEITTVDLVELGVDPDYVDQVLEQLSTVSIIENDEGLPSFVSEDLIPNYHGESIIVKQGEYPIDYSTNPNGDVIFDIEIVN